MNVLQEAGIGELSQAHELALGEPEQWEGSQAETYGEFGTLERGTGKEREAKDHIQGAAGEQGAGKSNEPRRDGFAEGAKTSGQATIKTPEPSGFWEISIETKGDRDKKENEEPRQVIQPAVLYRAEDDAPESPRQSTHDEIGEELGDVVNREHKLRGRLPFPDRHESAGKRAAHGDAMHTCNEPRQERGITVVNRLVIKHAFTLPSL